MDRFNQLCMGVPCEIEGCWRCPRSAAPPHAAGEVAQQMCQQRGSRAPELGSHIAAGCPTATARTQTPCDTTKLSMGAVFAMFAGFYYWIGEISGFCRPQWLRVQEDAEGLVRANALQAGVFLAGASSLSTEIWLGDVRLG